GGHGARVRACIYTPDIPALTAYHKERLELVREHVLEYLKAPTTKMKVKAAADKIAANW
ncbi:unnamed protein product, partial [marine sediment metagenome]